MTKQIQGGLRFYTSSGMPGARVKITSGESRAPSFPKNKTHKGPTTEVVGDTWGYSFTWSLRTGAQLIEQHQYMEFRYVNLVFEGAIPEDLQVSAWKTQYPWDATETTFNSSNATLNSIWELCRYTLEAGVLDTYTDSNTRERRPYEADGLVASTARGWLQRDMMWARHSHA